MGGIDPLHLVAVVAAAITATAGVVTAIFAASRERTSQEHLPDSLIVLLRMHLSAVSWRQRRRIIKRWHRRVTHISIKLDVKNPAGSRLLAEQIVTDAHAFCGQRYAASHGIRGWWYRTSFQRQITSQLTLQVFAAYRELHHIVTYAQATQHVIARTQAAAADVSSLQA